MRSGIPPLVICFCVYAVSCKTEFPNEIIVTSADVSNGVISNVGKAGESYRLYGLSTAYHLEKNKTELAKITIVDSKGSTYKLTDLRDPKSNNAFLKDTNIVVGPITVNDPNPIVFQDGLPAEARMPFTLYLVSEKVPLLPVADGAAAGNNFHLYSTQASAGITILSAEAFLTLYQFQIGSSAVIIPRGYDYNSNGGTTGSLIDLTEKNAYNSYISIIGPIATILNSDTSKIGWINCQVNMISLATPLPITLATDSALTITSPNWLSLTESYTTSLINYKLQFDEQFGYGKDRLLDFTLSASNLASDQKITIEVKSDNGQKKQWSYLPSTTGDVRDTIYGNSIHLITTLDYTISPSKYPRYILKVTSGAPTTCSILSLLLIAYHLIQH